MHGPAFESGSRVGKFWSGSSELLKLGDRLGAKALRRVAQALRVFTTRSAFSASSAVTVYNLLKRVSTVVRGEQTHE